MAHLFLALRCPIEIMEHSYLNTEFEYVYYVLITDVLSHAVNEATFHVLDCASFHLAISEWKIHKIYNSCEATTADLLMVHA